MRNSFFIFLMLFAACHAVAQDKEPVSKSIFIPDAVPVDTLGIYQLVEIMPSFPGGDSELIHFIKKRPYYPASALQDSIDGRVVLRLTIASDGNIAAVEVTKSLHPDCDSIAVGIVRQMPQWNAGRQEGIPVNVYFNLPVSFQLPSRGSGLTVVHALPDDFSVPFSFQDLRSKKDTQEGVPWISPELPTFPGGTEAMFAYIRANLHYPVTGGCFQGRVIVQFIVDEKGKIHNPTIVRSLIPEADREALRLVREMPDWTPTGDGIRRINHLMTIPVMFKLN